MKLAGLAGTLELSLAALLLQQGNEELLALVDSAEPLYVLAGNGSQHDLAGLFIQLHLDWGARAHPELPPDIGGNDDLTFGC